MFNVGLTDFIATEIHGLLPMIEVARHLSHYKTKPAIADLHVLIHDHIHIQ